jgi:hypothetical protein
MNYIGKYIDSAGRILEIRRADETAMPYRVRVVLPMNLKRKYQDHPDYPFEIVDELKAWIFDQGLSTEYLTVEAGILGFVGLGPTLQLRPIAIDELKPAISGGLYDDWEDDLGLPWALPLSVYKRQE